jgi:hypothetical protein
MRLLLALAALIASAQVEAQPRSASVLILTGDSNPERGPALLAEVQGKLASVQGRPTLAEGFPRVVASADYTGLKPGFTLVIAGFCDAAAVEAPLAELRKLFPGAYVRAVTGVEPTSCPAVAKPAARKLPRFGPPSYPSSLWCEGDPKEPKRSGSLCSVVAPEADWTRGTGAALVYGWAESCRGDKVARRIAVRRCDGSGPVAVDKLTCGEEVTTCIVPMGPDLLALEHSRSDQGATGVKLRVFDLSSGKRIASEEWFNDCGMADCEMGSVEDVDGDGMPELTFTDSRATDRPHRILRWQGGKFRDVGPFLWKDEETPPSP